MCVRFCFLAFFLLVSVWLMGVFLFELASWSCFLFSFGSFSFFKPFLDAWVPGSMRRMLHWCHMTLHWHQLREHTSCNPQVLQWVARYPMFVRSCMRFVSFVVAQRLQPMSLLMYVGLSAAKHKQESFYLS